MASRWPVVEDSDYNDSSTVSVSLDSLINDQQPSLNPEPCPPPQYTSSQLIVDGHLRGGSPSLTDVFQSSMDVSQQIGYCPNLKQASQPQEQQHQPKPEDEIPRSALEVESIDKESAHERKSLRKRFKKRSYSPESGAHQGSKPGPSTSKKTRRKKKYPRTTALVNPDRPYDTLPNGSQFQCDLCKCPYICNPLLKKVSKLKKSKQVAASPRHKIDPVTENKLTLCNACGLSFDRPRKTKKTLAVPSADEKNKYFEESQTFASALAVKMNDPSAEKLWCPNFKSRPCGCLQEYLSANGEEEEMNRRAQQLIEIMKNAKELSSQKCYNLNELPDSGKKTKRFRNIGLGNGQKRSKAFEEFVMLNRSQLRNELQLCERATQRILIYSNNFLHKKLKTEERECRATRVKGKAALGLLPDLSQLCNMRCCGDMCVLMVLTHLKLLSKWRERAISGQMEARRVLAEMLTPSGGVRSNCYKFISWVTGCSHSTIGRVNEQMQQTGGDREPPVHGLKKYWKENPRLKTKQKNSEGSTNSDLTEEMEETLDSPPEPQQEQEAPTTTAMTTIQQQQQHLTLGIGPKVVNTTNNSAITTVTNVPVETLNQLLIERQLLQQQLMQQTILQQLYQQQESTAQNPATVQQLLLKLIENNHVSQQNSLIPCTESTPVYTNCFLRTQPLISPSGSQVLTSAADTRIPTTMMVSLDHSALAQQPVTSDLGNVTCSQSNKIQQVQNQTNVSPVVTMSSSSSSSFLSSTPLALQHSLGTPSQVTLPLSSANEVSSVPVQTPLNSQSVPTNSTLSGTGVTPLTQMSLGLIPKSVPPSTTSKSDSESTIQTVSPTAKVTTIPLQTSPATKTLEMVSVNIPVISTNTTGLAENWTNLSVQVPQSHNSTNPPQRTNVTPSILPINVLQRFLNMTGVITTNETSVNTTATVSVPTTSNKYVCKKATNTGNTIICNPILPTQLGQQDQQIPVASENYSIISNPHIKLATSSSESTPGTSHSSTICVTDTSSNGQFLLPVQSTLPKEGAKVSNVLIGDPGQQYINCNAATVMFQTGAGDVELLQLVPLSVPQGGSEGNTGQTATLTTSPKNLQTNTEPSRTATTTTTTTIGVTTDLS